MNFVGVVVLPLFCCHKKYNIVIKKITEIADTLMCK